MKKSTTIVGAAATAALALGSAGMAALAAAPAEGVASPAALEAEAAEGTQAASPFVRVSNVTGVFAASQGVVTPTDRIANVFAKAAAAMCASMPAYDVTALQGKIAVSGNVAHPFDASVSEMAEAQGSGSYLLACACASNIPGGGAIANAQVEGVSLASIAVAAGA